jgi:hypothetical protein
MYLRIATRLTLASRAAAFCRRRVSRGYTLIFIQDINNHPAIKAHTAHIETIQILTALHFFFLKSRKQIKNDETKTIAITAERGMLPL